MLARFGITAVYAVVTLHTAEMFPTDIRNSALGTSSMCGHIGSTAAPYIVDFMVKNLKSYFKVLFYYNNLISLHL